MHPGGVGDALCQLEPAQTAEGGPQAEQNRSHLFPGSFTNYHTAGAACGWLTRTRYAHEEPRRSPGHAVRLFWQSLRLTSFLPFLLHLIECFLPPALLSLLLFPLKRPPAEIESIQGGG